MHFAIGLFFIVVSVILIAIFWRIFLPLAVLILRLIGVLLLIAVPLVILFIFAGALNDGVRMVAVALTLIYIGVVAWAFHKPKIIQPRQVVDLHAASIIWHQQHRR